MRLGSSPVEKWRAFMTIKKLPEDFVVEERLTGEMGERIGSARRAFALYRLSKKGLSTPEAVSKVARFLRVPSGLVAYAGLKDKHADCIQHITIDCEKSKTFFEDQEQIEGSGWSAQRMGWVDEAIAAEAIEANRFTLVVRGMSFEKCKDMDEAIALLGNVANRAPAAGDLPQREVGQGRCDDAEDGGSEVTMSPKPRIPFAPTTLTFVNYFGDQRFGSARHHQGFLAKFLIKGAFEDALRLAIATPARKDRRGVKTFKQYTAAKWGAWKEIYERFKGDKLPELKAIERLMHSSGDFRAAFCALPYFFQQLCVYAYQSHLWNAAARHLVGEAFLAYGPILAAADPFGEMLFPAASSIPSRYRDMNLPLLGRRTVLEEPWKDSVEAVLLDEQIQLEELSIPGVRRPFFGEAPRPLFAEARNFLAGMPVKETGPAKRYGRELQFELPRGSYATVLLRALGC